MNILATTILLLILSTFNAVHAAYKVGVGRADCTGPSAEITFMGYAKLGQKGCGVHLRQFARAYIFDDGNNRAAFVTIDACMMNHPVREAVLKKLKSKYNDTYTLDNLVLSGTHTHSAPGGFLKDVMLDISILGFVPETFNALVDGIFRAIQRAHDNMVDARIFINSAELLDSNINRSPASYEYNPEEEIKKYKYNVDKDLVQLKIVHKSNDTLIGAINWFAVHPTSMNNSNCLVTSDNVGYASILLESSINTGELPGKGDFVGAFASTNLGDVSPNTKGPICINTGEECEYVHSTCNGQTQFCIASGPGNDMFESTKIIATNMFKKAQELISSNDAKEVSGAIQYIHRFVDMPNEKATVQTENGTLEVHGCLPAMGYGFAAGTTDGPGEFDFAQGNKNTSNIFWNLVRDFIFPPSSKDMQCHFPKPILIMTGRIKLPYEWQPEVVATQLIQIGQVILAAVPGEFTTMSGRRLRETIKEEIDSKGGSKDTQIVIAGLSNVYTSYIATPEEYQLQRYEGASTIFGPHTLTIYLKIYKELANNLITGKKLKFAGKEPSPEEFPRDLLSLVTPVYFDSAGSWFQTFGDCIIQPDKSYSIGDTASATFISGHPRNNNLQEKTFLTVEKKKGDNWQIIATDASWETRFIWRRTSTFKASSTAEIRWEITDAVEPGTYRINHYGYYKFILGGVYAYSGTSRSFTVK